MAGKHDYTPGARRHPISEQNKTNTANTAGELRNRNYGRSPDQTNSRFKEGRLVKQERALRQNPERKAECECIERGGSHGFRYTPFAGVTVFSRTRFLRYERCYRSIVRMLIKDLWLILDNEQRQRNQDQDR